MARDETFGQLREILEEMPSADREVLTFRYALDYDTEQIAELLGINSTAVHMRLSRARQRLAQRLKEQGIGRLP
jgi:RNA polymerase sigma-70 factor (ECF subfamily)